jgi:hypothetical protein
MRVGIQLTGNNASKSFIAVSSGPAIVLRSVLPGLPSLIDQ